MIIIIIVKFIRVITD